MRLLIRCWLLTAQQDQPNNRGQEPQTNHNIQYGPDAESIRQRAADTKCQHCHGAVRCAERAEHSSAILIGCCRL